MRPVPRKPKCGIEDGCRELRLPQGCVTSSEAPRCLRLRRQAEIGVVALKVGTTTNNVSQKWYDSVPAVRLIYLTSSACANSIARLYCPIRSYSSAVTVHGAACRFETNGPCNVGESTCNASNQRISPSLTESEAKSLVPSMPVINESGCKLYTLRSSDGTPSFEVYL